MENFSIPETMKAMTLVAYDKLQLATVPVPKPGPGEVLCRIKSVAICGSDPKMIHGDYAWTNWPPYYPFIMGHEWAGQIVALGEGVNDFKVGDRVAGEAHVGCGKCDNCKKGHYTVCLNYGKDGTTVGWIWATATTASTGRAPTQSTTSTRPAHCTSSPITSATMLPL